MNIFYLSNDTEQCAREHPDKHVVKMILETAQLLSAAHHVLGTSLVTDSIYKLTHQNHPCAKWVRLSSSNYEWLFSLLVELNNEYTYRYGKVHKVRREGLEQLLANLPTGISEATFTEPPQAMPDECRNVNTVLAYQQYYLTNKIHLLTWKIREKPSWVV